MRYCKMCGCILDDDDPHDYCPCCRDDLDESGIKADDLSDEEANEDE